MSTFTNKKIIDEIIANNGYYENDPRVAMIVEYTNAYGNIAWGVTWLDKPLASQRKYLEETEYVRNPRIIWEAK